MNLKSRIEHFIRSEVIENFLSHISVKSVVGVVCGFRILMCWWAVTD